VGIARRRGSDADANGLFCAGRSHVCGQNLMLAEA
jgi:hypothetical protein